MYRIIYLVSILRPKFDEQHTNPDLVQFLEIEKQYCYILSARVLNPCMKYNYYRKLYNYIVEK